MIRTIDTLINQANELQEDQRTDWLDNLSPAEIGIFASHILDISMAHQRTVDQLIMQANPTPSPEIVTAGLGWPAFDPCDDKIPYHKFVSGQPKPGELCNCGRFSYKSDGLCEVVKVERVEDEEGGE